MSLQIRAFTSFMSHALGRRDGHGSGRGNEGCRQACSQSAPAMTTHVPGSIRATRVSTQYTESSSLNGITLFTRKIAAEANRVPAAQPETPEADPA